MTPQEFKCWLENTIRDARKAGLSDDLILFELMEQVKLIFSKEYCRFLENQYMAKRLAKLERR